MIAEHAALAPSGAHIWAGSLTEPGCPGSVQLQAAYPEPADSDDAREGTAAHWYVTETLQGREPGSIAPNGVPITPEMVDAAQGILVDVRDAMRFHPGAVLRVEHRVAMPLVHDQNWGTPDVQLIDVAQRWFAVWDYKYGHRYVDAAENMQLCDYAIGVLREFAPCYDWPHWRVSLNIAQPRNYHASGPIREWQTDGGKLLDVFTPHLRAAAAEAMGPDPKLRTGPHCLDCSAAHACPALQRAGALAIDISQRVSAVDLPPHALGLELRLLDDAAKRIDARRTALEEHALGMVRAGQPVPFFTAEHTTGREKWTAPAHEIAALGDLMGLAGSALLKTDAITPQQAREAFKKAGIDASVIDAYADRPRGALRLKRVPDNAAKLAFE